MIKSNHAGGKTASYQTERNWLVSTAAVILLLGLLAPEAINGEVDIWRLTAKAAVIGIGVFLTWEFG